MAFFKTEILYRPIKMEDKSDSLHTTYPVATQKLIAILFQQLTFQVFITSWPPGETARLLLQAQIHRSELEL